MTQRIFPEKEYTFPCGCFGICPKKGRSNKFVVGRKGRNFQCRVAVIIHTSKQGAERRGKGYPIDPNTPHYIIRNMMEENICWICGESLEWTIGHITCTPTLHHDPYKCKDNVIGFSHPLCNLGKVKEIIFRLRLEIKGNYIDDSRK